MNQYHFSRRPHATYTRSAPRYSPLAILAAATLLAHPQIAMAAAPVAVDDVRVTAIDTNITINLLANDFDPDGDGITLIDFSQPGNGTVSISGNGNAVVYTPNPGFSGNDSFTYIIQENAEEQLTSTATVTITVRENEFMPYADSSSTQSLAEALNTACNTLSTATEAALDTGNRALLQRCREMTLLAAGDAEVMDNILRQLAPEETLAQARVATEVSRGPTRGVSNRISQLRTAQRAGLTINGIAMNRTDPLGGGASADSSDALVSRFGAFATVQLDNIERDRTALENGYDSSGNALTVGIDYRLNHQWIIGAAYGYSKHQLDYTRNAGSLDVEAGSLLLFSAYQYGDFLFDIQAGYSGLAFDTERYVRYSVDDGVFNERISGTTNGHQWLLNTQLQWQWHHGGLSLYPFLRWDHQTNAIKGYGETGNSGLEMQLGEQNVEQNTFSAGAQGTYAINTGFGVLLPMLKLSFFSETDAKRDAVTGNFYYDLDSTNDYSLESDGTDRDFIEVALGISAVLQGGISSFIEYKTLAGYDHVSADHIQLGFRYEF